MDLAIVALHSIGLMKGCGIKKADGLLWFSIDINVHYRVLHPAKCKRPVGFIMLVEYNWSLHYKSLLACCRCLTKTVSGVLLVSFPFCWRIVSKTSNQPGSRRRCQPEEMSQPCWPIRSKEKITKHTLLTVLKQLVSHLTGRNMFFFMENRRSPRKFQNQPRLLIRMCPHVSTKANPSGDPALLLDSVAIWSPR